MTSSASTEKFSNKSDFPLLVVEEIHSKPVKETLIAEDERLCSIWKESLKAQGKWRGDELEVQHFVTSSCCFFLLVNIILFSSRMALAVRFHCSYPRVKP